MLRVEKENTESSLEILNNNIKESIDALDGGFQELVLVHLNSPFFMWEPHLSHVLPLILLPQAKHT